MSFSSSQHGCEIFLLCGRTRQVCSMVVDYALGWYFSPYVSIIPIWKFLLGPSPWENPGCAPAYYMVPIDKCNNFNFYQLIDMECIWHLRVGICLFPARNQRQITVLTWAAACRASARSNSHLPCPRHTPFSLRLPSAQCPLPSVQLQSKTTYVQLCCVCTYKYRRKLFHSNSQGSLVTIGYRCDVVNDRRGNGRCCHLSPGGGRRN